LYNRSVLGILTADPDAGDADGVALTEAVVNCDFIRMPDATGFGD